MLRLIGFVSLLWLVMVNPFAVVAQDSNPAVLDTMGQALESGVEYYILPSTTGGGGGGGLTLIDRNGSCPLYVGQEDQANLTGFPVVFIPFFADETIIRESRDFTIRFEAITICIRSTTWALDEESNPTHSGRTLIRTSGASDPVYLRIIRDGESYKLSFCPTDVCPICKFNCGDVGVSVEGEKRLLALYVPALPVVFRRA